MPAPDLLLAVDQGTGSTKAMLVDATGAVVSEAASPLGQTHPQPGWVEQDAEEIWAGLRDCVAACVSAEHAGRVAGVALSVQRETVLLWDRETGDPVSPALSWQDRRTGDRADTVEQAGHGDYVLARTGLPLDPMFSALKAGWLLDAHDPDRVRSGSGAWCVSTLDAWLLARLAGPSASVGGTGGSGREVVTEVGCASRTQLLDIDTADWDPRLLDLFGVPAAALPRVVASTGPFAPVAGLDPLPDGTPVLAVLADSHAALFAHAGWRPGLVKATYGTGTSVMALGPRASAASGVCATIAWQHDDEVALALEANIRSTGRTLTWLADLLEVEVDVLFAEAAAAPTSDGVTLVPAFGGLGAPWWDRDAVPVLSGLSLGTRRPQLARAALESIALQVDDAVSAFAGLGGPLAELACDGGMTRSTALMQLQADVTGLPVRVGRTANLSALGVVHLAGLGLGWWTWSDLEGLQAPRGAEALDGPDGAGPAAYLPSGDDDLQRSRREAWAREVARSRFRTPRHLTSKATS